MKNKNYRYYRSLERFYKLLPIFSSHFPLDYAIERIQNKLELMYTSFTYIPPGPLKLITKYKYHHEEDTDIQLIYIQELQISQMFISVIISKIVVGGMW